MSNVHDVKIKKVTINLDGKEETIIFDFNAMALLEEKYNNIQGIFDALDKGSIKGVRDMIWAGLSHKYMDEITEEMPFTAVEIGRKLQLGQVNEIGETLKGALIAALPKKEDVLDEEAYETVVDDEINDILKKQT